VIDPKIIKLFVKIGSLLDTEKINLMEKFPELSSLDHVNRMGPDEWRNSIKELEKENLIFLVKALAYIEEKLNWCGGSVSSVIWCYNFTSKKYPEIANDLAEWIVKNDRNPYAPTGSGMSNFHVWEKLKLRDIRKENQKLEENLCSLLGSYNFEVFKNSILSEQISKMLKENERKDELNSLKSEIQRKIEENISLNFSIKELKSENRCLKRKEIIHKFKDSSTIEKLRFIASQPDLPLDFFPDEWGLVGEEDLKKLTPEEIEAISERMKAKRKGIWKKLYQTIKEKMF